MAFNFTLKPPVDSLDQANIFAELIHGTNAVLNWRCIHGANNSIEQLRGSLADSKEMLSNLNGRGFNIFMTFNQTDGKGVKGSNIIAISGLFADLDGAPLENINQFPFEPTIITETSPGKFHAIYKVNDMPLTQFSRCQRALAITMSGDEAVCDLPRIIRTPGFHHTKDNSQPFLSHIIHFNPDAIYDGSDIVTWVDTNHKKCSLGQTFSMTENNERLVPIDQLGTVVEGGRNMLLTRYVGLWFAQGKTVEEVQILADQVNGRNLTPPLSEAEVDSIINSINNRDLTNHSERRSAIQFFNDNYCLVTLGGRALVLREFDQTFLDVASFRTIHATNVEYDKQPANIWLKINNNRYFDYVFDPSGEVKKTIYNSFKGWPVAPKAGNCNLYLDHIRTIICDGDEDLFNYVLGWMAHLFQKPTDKPGVALVLLGGQGVGKGEFVRHFANLLGPYFAPISDISHLVGQFNSHIMNLMLVLVDEAMWGRDKKNEGKLKALITEKTLTFERKYVEAMQKKNYSRFIFASNEEHAVPMAADDRRMLAMKVSEARKDDHAYFRAIDTQMRNGGYQALMHELMNLDLSNFEIRRKPNTYGSVGQKLHTLPSVAWWWYNVLQDGCYKKIEMYSSLVGTPFGEFVQSTEMLDSYLIARKNDPYRHGQVSGCNEFVTKLIELCPSIERKRQKSQYSRERVRGLQVPDLETCRKEFERKTNMVGLIDWEDDDTIGEA